jgi:mono/diheme cytochrome c family protein
MELKEPLIRLTTEKGELYPRYHASPPEAMRDVPSDRAAQEGASAMKKWIVLTVTLGLGVLLVNAAFAQTGWKPEFQLGPGTLGPGASGPVTLSRQAGGIILNVLLRGRHVYETECAICHGLNGDGAGIASNLFHVAPRDFRPGLFKFRSTPSGSLPTDGDLLGTITEGVRWTAMASRRDLSEADRMAVVQYIKTFSLRFATESPAQPMTVPPAPARSDALVEQGKRLYEDADCAKCHGERGIGDGPSAAGEKDDWGRATWPSDLTWRPLKRGSSPEKIYLTIATGLTGTPMPSFGDALDSQQIWALVYYLDSLVPAEHRVSSVAGLGEETVGWLVIHWRR